MQTTHRDAPYTQSSFLRDPRPERLQPLREILVAALDLVDVLDRAPAPVRTLRR